MLEWKRLQERLQDLEGRQRREQWGGSVMIPSSGGRKRRSGPSVAGAHRRRSASASAASHRTVRRQEDQDTLGDGSGSAATAPTAGGMDDTTRGTQEIRGQGIHHEPEKSQEQEAEGNYSGDEIEGEENVPPSRKDFVGRGRPWAKEYPMEEVVPSRGVWRSVSAREAMQKDRQVHSLGLTKKLQETPVSMCRSILRDTACLLHVSDLELIPAAVKKLLSVVSAVPKMQQVRRPRTFCFLFAVWVAPFLTPYVPNSSSMRSAPCRAPMVVILVEKMSPPRKMPCAC